MKSEFKGFPSEGIVFFRKLKKNNNREWFLAHKQIYETKARQPLMEFIGVLQKEMSKYASEIHFDSAKSIFRIYRDIRFSKDKSPYKTHMAAHFGSQGKAHTSAGLYIHLDANEIFWGGGLYHPETTELRIVRASIAQDDTQLRKIIRDPKFQKLFGGLSGDQLSRTPKGFPPDHPAADLLRYKDYVAFAKEPVKLAMSGEVVSATVERFRAMMPLIRYLNQTLSQKASHFF